jgi:hypothetical protein
MKLIPNTPEVSQALKEKYGYTDNYMSFNSGFHYIIMFDNPIATGYFLHYEIKKISKNSSIFSFFRKKQAPTIKVKFSYISHTELLYAVIPDIIEMSKIGFVYGWGDELCENIRKKLAVIK